MEKNKRNSAVEVLRIISMLMIIMHHYILYGVQQSYSNDVSGVIYSSGDVVHKITANLMLPGGVVGVAIFFIVSGYFGISSGSVSLNSIKNIVVAVLIYSLFGTVLWCVLVKSSILPAASGIKISVIRGLFPLSNEIYWFASAYVIIMLMKPFLDNIIKQLEFKKAIFVLCMLILFYGLMRITVAHYLRLWNGIIFYFLGAVLKTNEAKFANTPKVVYLLLGILGWIGYAVCNMVGHGTLGGFSSICIMGTVSAFGFFEFFININEFYNDIINSVAALTFGVYLFHEHPLLREMLWENVFHVAEYQYQSNLFPIYAVCTICTVFFIGCFFELFRKKCLFLLKTLTE